MLPFNTNMQEVKMNEKDLVDVLNAMSGTILTTNKDPQVLRTAGMKYTVHNDVEFAKSGNKNALIDMQIGDKKVDVENPRRDKKFKVIVSNYLFNHDLTKNILSKYKKNAKSVGHEQDLFTNYLKSHKNIDLKQPTEKRANFTHEYTSRDELNAARKEVLGDEAESI